MLVDAIVIKAFVAANLIWSLAQNGNLPLLSTIRLLWL